MPTSEPRIIFADGISKISVVNNVVRLDLVEVEPMANGANQERPTLRLLLPLNMLNAIITDLTRIASQSGAAAQGAPAQAAAAPAPGGGGTMIPPPPLGPPPRWNPKS